MNSLHFEFIKPQSELCKFPGSRETPVLLRTVCLVLVLLQCSSCSVLKADQHINQGEKHFRPVFFFGGPKMSF